MRRWFQTRVKSEVQNPNIGGAQVARVILSVLALLVVAPDSPAQSAEDAQWPQRVVRFIVSSAPGSAGDSVCRIVAQKLSQRLGQQFVIDNRAGAAGLIAGEALARAAPDGYTIGLITTSTHVIAPIFNPSMSYDSVKDFAPVSMIGSSPYVLAVYPGLPVKNVADLVALAEARPRALNNAAFGTTSLGHLAGVLFAQLAGIELNQVAYRSSAQAVLDAVAGRIEMQFSTLPPALPLIREGKLRALATTGAKRASSLPDVPTLAEAGLAGYEVSLWMGIAAPADMPKGIVARLNREIADILNAPDVKDALVQQGMESEPGASEDLANRIDSDLRRWRQVVAKLRIKEQ